MTAPKIQTVKPDGENGARYYVIEGNDNPLPGVTSVLKMKASEGLIHWAANESAEYAVRAIRDGVPTFDVEGHIFSLEQLCRVAPDVAYDSIKKARFRRNKIAVDKGNDAHDTVERVAFMSLDELRDAYAEAQRTQGQAFSLNPWAIAAWGAFVKRFNVVVLHSEVTCVSRNGHVGTCDLIVEMDTPWLDVERGVVIMDTKTGKGVYPEVAMQLAAYRYSDTIVTPLGEGFNYIDVPKVDGAAVFWPNEVDWSLIPVSADERDYEAFLALLTVFEWDKGAAKKALGKAVVGRKSRKATPPINWDMGAGA